MKLSRQEEFSHRDATVIIPTYNEAGNIGRLIDKLLKLYPGIKIIVADDGSKDGTQQIVKQKKVILLDRSRKRVKGLTAAVIDALQLVKTKLVVVMDADFQHPPENVGEIIKKLSRYELVIGARKSTKGWTMLRKLISFGGTLLANTRLLLSGKKLVFDPMSGFFGAHTELFKSVVKTHRSGYIGEGFKVLFDTLKHLPLSVKLGYVEFDFGLRTAGESKINKKHIICLLKSLVS